MCLDLKVDGRVSLTHFTQAYFIKLSRLNECNMRYKKGKMICKLLNSLTMY